MSKINHKLRLPEAIKEDIKPKNFQQKLFFRALNPENSKSTKKAHKVGLIILSVLFSTATASFGIILVKKLSNDYSAYKKYINEKIDSINKPFPHAKKRAVKTPLEKPVEKPPLVSPPVQSPSPIEEENNLFNIDLTDEDIKSLTQPKPKHSSLDKENNIFSINLNDDDFVDPSKKALHVSDDSIDNQSSEDSLNQIKIATTGQIIKKIPTDKTIAFKLESTPMAWIAFEGFKKTFPTVIPHIRKMRLNGKRTYSLENAIKHVINKENLEVKTFKEKRVKTDPRESSYSIKTSIQIDEKNVLSFQLRGTLLQWETFYQLINSKDSLFSITSFTVDGIGQDINSIQALLGLPDPEQSIEEIQLADDQELENQEKELLEANKREKAARAQHDDLDDSFDLGSSIHSKTDLASSIRSNPEESFEILINLNEGNIDGAIQFNTTFEGSSIEHLVAHLVNHYGSILTDVVLARYEQMLSKESLTILDFKKIIAAIAAQVTIDDLQRLYQSIKDQTETLGCAEFLKNYHPTAYQALVTSSNTQDELSSEDLQNLLLAFRTLPYGEDENINVLDYVNSEALSTDNLFINDLTILTDSNQWNQLDLNYYPLALAEYTGKTLAYNDLTPGMIFAIPTEDNQPQFLKVYKQFNHYGVIPTLLVPTKHSNSEDVHLLFRGTASNIQWLRNTDFRGVGANEFSKNKIAIIDMVKEYLASTSAENITLNISGHSLGGCDTQRGFVLLLQQIADEVPEFKKISKIIVTAHNAARAEHRLNNKLRAAVEKISQLKSDGKSNLEISLTYIRYFDVNQHQDVVQQCGETLVGFDNPANLGSVKDHLVFFNARDFFSRRIFDITVNKSFGFKGTVDLHTIRAFNKVFCGGTFNDPNTTLYCKTRNDRATITGPNETQEETLVRDRLDKVMARHFRWNPETKKPVLLAMKWYALQVLRAASKPLHIAINQTHNAVIKSTGLK